MMRDAFLAVLMVTVLAGTAEADWTREQIPNENDFPVRVDEIV